MPTVNAIWVWVVRLRLAAAVVGGVVVASCGAAPGSGDAGFAPATAGAETVVVTPTGESWFDPEVLVDGGSGWMTWQDGVGGVWLAELDLTDGLVGPDAPVLVASDAARMLDTNNGPELGVDAQGISLWYTASTPDGLRIGRVPVGIAGATVEWVSASGFLSPLPSRRPDEPTTSVVALRRTSGFGTAVWFDESDPSRTVDLVWLPERTGGDARWVVGTGLITVAGELDSGAAVELVDTDMGAITEIGSADDGEIENTYGWIDPTSGRVSVLAVLGGDEGDEVVVWDIAGDGSAVERLRLTSPVEDHPYVGSPEPLLLDGRTWVTMTVANHPTTLPARTDQQVWLVPLDGGESVRCDDGTTATTTRVDPETIVTAGEIFVYYYAWDATISEVHRCAISTSTLGG